MFLHRPHKQRLWRAAAIAAALALCWGLPALAARQRGKTAALGTLTLPPALAVSNAPQPEGLVVGYYPDYARAEGFLPADLPVDLLTNIHYAFADIDSQGRLVLANPEVDLPNLAGLRALREERPQLRILLSVGGWERSGGFSDAAASPASRQTFAQSAAELIAEQGLDGIDLDWEFPVAGGKEGMPHRPEDGENFTLLLRAVREALDARGEQDGRRYLLSAAIPPGKDFLGNIQPTAIAATLDYLFFMGYDFHGPWDSLTGFNAPLDSPGGDTPQTDSIREGVENWRKAGVPPEKLVLGMPLYGYRYQLAPGASGLNSPFTSAGSVSYDQIAAQYIPEYRRLFHTAAQLPYLLEEGWFLSYDDPSSIAAKARFAREEELGGIGFWELSQDRDARLIAAGVSAWEGSAISS